MTAVPIIPRNILATHFGNDVRMITAFEDMNAGAAETQAASASNVEATTALQDATVIVLSANGAFTGERVLVLADGLEAIVTDDEVTIQLSGVARAQNYGVVFVASGDSQLVVPVSGTVVTFEDTGTSLGNYANDAAAAAGGVGVGGLYHNAGAVRVRLV